MTTATFAYRPDRSQRGDLHLPAGDSARPVAVLLHGGSWRRRYRLGLMEPLAADLVERGWAVWNLEYRRVGLGRRGLAGDVRGRRRRDRPPRRARRRGIASRPRHLDPGSAAWAAVAGWLGRIA